MKICITILLLFSTALTVRLFAQSDKSFPIRYSPKKGAYLYFANQSLSAQAPYQKIGGVRIHRRTGKNFKELVTLSRPSSVENFIAICGEESWKQFLLMKNFKTDQEGWKFILAHTAMDDYGTLSFDMKFRQAMGNAFLDTEAANLSDGKQWTYKIEMLDASGQVTQMLEGAITGGDVTFRFDKPRKARAIATDSSVFVRWYIKSKIPLSGIVMADVYRQEGGKGSYKKLATPLLATTKEDSILFLLSDEVLPATLYRYCIRPTDEWGNASQPSDTISLLTFNFARLPLLENMKAKDTLNAIAVSWKPLGDQPQLIGVEIQRSRDARGNYVVLDTVAVSESSYLDIRVLPSIPYFYRLRPISIKGMEREKGYSGFVNAFVRNTLKHPDPPYGLIGNLVNGKVLLNWQSVSDPDVYGYFVYRSTSHNGRFEVISPSLVATSFTDTSSISGRTQYVYAVKAVNKNSLESDFSNQVTMRQALMELPATPGGLQAYADNKKIILQWPAANTVDHAIAGYNVYRREAQPKNDFDLKQSAAAQASNLKFTLLNRDLVIQPYYEDMLAVVGVNYEYAVASVDVFGMEGTYSPFAKVTVPVITRVISSCTIRKVSAGVELGWDYEMAARADAVIIYRKKAGELKFQKIATVPKLQVIYTDKSIQKDTLYIYVISAEKNNMALAKSEEKNIRY
jgi:fibronectin type 3 domain-containing protein